MDDFRVDDAFWVNVDRSSDCWIWVGSRTSDGYGRVRRPGQPEVRAHRVALAAALGRPLKPGMQTCHTHTGNRLCVNPAHLYEGTNRENMHDKVKDGTDPLGSRNPAAKLNEGQAREIKWLLTWGNSCQAIAREFGVSRRTITAIRRGERWTHVNM